MDRSIRAQRVRAFSRKTRTGCLTCKKRHKKCDEEKPTCKRCRDGGYVCDGYTPQSQAVTTKTQNRSLPILAAKVSTPTLPRLPGDTLESNYYVYFFSDIISQLEITPYLNKEFWNRNILVPSQNSECVRHAVLALGATHWQYSTRNQLSTASFDRFVLWHYNEAISKLTSNQESPQDMSTVLTCCILFVILESLRGDFGEAIRHLESGTRILTNHVPKTYLPNRDFQELAAIFHAIASQVAIFSPERVFPDVTHLLMPAKKQKRIEGEFRNLDEAEDVMNKFDDMVNHISWDLDQEWENEESECNTQWSILRQNVQVWQCQFEILVNKLSAGKEPIDSEKVLNLRIQHKLWELLIEEESDVDENAEAHLDSAECNTLLDQLEKLWCNPTRPRFGLKIDLTAALFQLYVYCTDENVRQRIICMLRAQSRREIIWDSGQLADFLESDMVLRAVGLQTERWPEIGPSANDGALLVFRPKSSRESSES
ncbi:uncharacterized protein BKA55DRAFT_542938 [Fusarium redolens]|uniref:Zn(2)-C6 fungal-type domain-containing protein n=1 Tax=Fusarium redolens TaxID=48865 RepID=A0A9P9GK09_FUSRE|nr:uncharacterized protein BKA55DRAFT_542938 [Fusarium redolens]KAH7240351.1 hypothetical protein BKA55DRAFT_542938 [Fusarium redolens]